MKKERQLPAKTYLDAKAGLLALDEIPGTTVAIGQAVSWLDILAANAPGERSVAPTETTVYLNAAHQIIKRRVIPHMERATRRKLIRAIRKKRQEVQSTQIQPEQTSLLNASDALTTIYFTSAVTGVHAAALAVRLRKALNHPYKEQ